MADDRLKILMIAPTPFFADRGCHVRIYEEARALSSLGHQVLIVTYHLGREMEGIATVRSADIPWYGKLEAGPSWHKLYLDVILFLKALFTVRRFRPDVIHAHLHEGAFIGMFIGKIFRIPMLFDCQGSLTAELIDHGFIGRGSLLHWLFRWLERIVNGGADFIVTSSGKGAAELTCSWNMPPDKVEGIIDGVDISVFTPYPKAIARKSVGLSPELPTAVFLGVLNRYQGIDLLLESIRILKERGKGIHFLIMGFPEGEYRAKAEIMGIGDLVTFTGRVEYAKTPIYLSAGDIAVSPKISLTEANGKLLNYMACGLPTVVFDNPVNREILGNAGVYARPGDSTDLADRIERLIVNREKMEELAALGRERAEQLHSWHSRVERLVEIYRSMAESPCR